MQRAQGKVYGRVVDWWAVGVLAWEMCTGDNPFYHDNPEQVAIKVQVRAVAPATVHNQQPYITVA